MATPLSGKAESILDNIYICYEPKNGNAHATALLPNKSFLLPIAAAVLRCYFALVFYRPVLTGNETCMYTCNCLVGY